MSTTVEIVSPEKLLVSRDVDMVVIPATEGELGILRGHAPMIVLLQGGAVRLYEAGQVTEVLFIAGGFADVAPNRCTVLASEVLPISELSRNTARVRLSKAQTLYDATNKLDPAALDIALAGLQSAKALLACSQAD